jgi:hypothetical protein
MILVRGRAAGTALTGTLYGRGERAPSFRGAPEIEADYVWVCDEFYEVASGGQVQRVDGREVNVAFESPAPRGYDSRETALEAAEEHVRTQFQRIGVDRDAVEIAVIEDPDGEADAGRGARETGGEGASQ